MSKKEEKEQVVAEMNSSLIPFLNEDDADYNLELKDIVNRLLPNYLIKSGSLIEKSRQQAKR